MRHQCSNARAKRSSSHALHITYVLCTCKLMTHRSAANVHRPRSRAGTHLSLGNDALYVFGAHLVAGSHKPLLLLLLYLNQRVTAQMVNTKKPSDLFSVCRPGQPLCYTATVLHSAEPKATREVCVCNVDDFRSKALGKRAGTCAASLLSGSVTTVTRCVLFSRNRSRRSPKTSSPLANRSLKRASGASHRSTLQPRARPVSGCCNRGQPVEARQMILYAARACCYRRMQSSQLYDR